jgi:hypothetical protein
MRSAYESALAHYESGKFQAAIDVLQAREADATQAADGPTQMLLRLAREAAANPPERFDPVFKLDGK